MPPVDRYTSQHGGVLAEHHEHHEPEKRYSSTFLIVLVSLLFVAVFGGALVGGVVSGDPSNGFFITIIVASAVAVTVAAVVSVRHYYKNRDEVDSQYKDRDMDIRGTFTRSDEEDEEAGYYDRQDRHQPARTPVDARIREVRASGVAPGDVSAMSPATYDVDSYAQTESFATRSNYHGNGYRLRGNPSKNPTAPKRGPFDFASVSSARSMPVREDPPEDSSGPAQTYLSKSRSKDPSAAVATPAGNVIREEERSHSDVGLNSPSGMSHATYSTVSRYDVEKEDTRASNRKSATDDESAATEKRRGRSKSPKRSRSKSPARPRSKSPGQTKKSSDDKKETIAPPPPPPPRSKKSKSSSKSSVATPTASEAGSTVSSLFLKPFNSMFGKKRTTSEAGYSEASSVVKSKASSEAGASSINVSKSQEVKSSSSASDTEGKPPKPEKRRELQTIQGGGDDDRYTPSTTGKSSVVSIPPPKRIPSTPGSEAPSEFRSMAESSVFSNGVASSTFNPAARDRAILRSQKNVVPLGAAFNDMPVYYEEDESAVTSVVNSEQPEPSIGYDVFAPPGPLGIVVDTIDKGCVVHSLKKSSPMQGLINPGDLIIGLDDFNVRKMDAASLTKLMAKKSLQKERKFTLLPVGDV